MLDLDTVIVGSIDELVTRPEPFIAWSVRDDAPGRFNTSMVLILSSVQHTNSCGALKQRCSMRCILFTYSGP